MELDQSTSSGFCLWVSCWCHRCGAGSNPLHQDFVLCRRCLFWDALAITRSRPKVTAMRPFPDLSSFAGRYTDVSLLWTYPLPKLADALILGCYGVHTHLISNGSSLSWGPIRGLIHTISLCVTLHGPSCHASSVACLPHNCNVRFELLEHSG